MVNISEILSKRKINNYVKNGGGYCPFCESDNISFHEITPDDGICTQFVSCDDCGKDWDDIFKLVNIY